MLEIEKTYLAKYIPEGLADCESKEILDLYFPARKDNPMLRLRQHGESYQMTKKYVLDENDASSHEECTIILDEEEFNEFKKLPSKVTHKIRYYYPYDGLTAEIDVFQEELQGLVLVDFEFENEEEMKKFTPPDWCLADVTQEIFAAGGMICGKKYEDVEKEVERFGYKKLFFREGYKKLFL